jgi:hypothetical protein
MKPPGLRGMTSVILCFTAGLSPSRSVTADPAIDIQFEGRTPDVGNAVMRQWIERSTAIVAAYFGVFPVPSLDLRVATDAGNGMGSGRTFGGPPPRIEITVGQHTSPQGLYDDWVLVHEMIHLSLPAIDAEHNWLAEGVATYVEGVARVQAGNLSEVQLWKERLVSIPKGLPQDDDHGLDRTHTWARTYWGGALYCLLADVEIRKRSHGRVGLQDALREIARQGAGMSTAWPIERILAVGDSATGTSVMRDLYSRMKATPFRPDLRGLWNDLGIRSSGGMVSFDDSAPLADVRRAITQARTAVEPLIQKNL